jgi:hypothetical protein
MIGTDKWNIFVVPSRHHPELSDIVVTDVKEPEKEYHFAHAFIKGVPCLHWCPPSRYETIDRLIHYRSDDILVSTYPKCGTTWAEQVVLLLKQSTPSSAGNAPLLLVSPVCDLFPVLLLTRFLVRKRAFNTYRSNS